MRTSTPVYDLSAFVSASTFVRSFAYATGPAYGLLLDQADPGWRRKLASSKGLAALLDAALLTPASAAPNVKAREGAYDDGSLLASERKRDREKTARMAALRATLVDGPVLTLPLNHANYQFNPQSLRPLPELGTVYPTLRLTDDWGVLEVENGGALLDKDMKVATISAAGIASSKLEGKGWRLTLNKGWAIQPGDRKGDFAVRQTIGLSH
ncbi:MAG: hypothetical protein ABIR29_02410 [Chthoniobacterales bacterium]